jgi:hypothetical protein
MAVIEAIATTYLEADAASVTFSSLGSYEHLQLRCSIKGGRDGSTNRTCLRLNGDTGANYSNHSMFASASTAYASAYTGDDRLFSAYNTTPSISSANSSLYATGIIDIFDYRNANKNTTVSCQFAADLGTYWYVYDSSGLWANTAAVTSITILMNGSYTTARGSEFTLYGLNSA